MCQGKQICGLTIITILQSQSSDDHSDVAAQTSSEVHVNHYEVAQDPGYQQVCTLVITTLVQPVVYAC